MKKLILATIVVFGLVATSCTTPQEDIVISHLNDGYQKRFSTKENLNIKIDEIKNEKKILVQDSIDFLEKELTDFINTQFQSDELNSDSAVRKLNELIMMDEESIVSLRKQSKDWKDLSKIASRNSDSYRYAKKATSFSDNADDAVARVKLFQKVKSEIIDKDGYINNKYKSQDPNKIIAIQFEVTYTQTNPIALQALGLPKTNTHSKIFVVRPDYKLVFKILKV